MAESSTVTGSKHDLLLDASRCLRMRYSASSCQRCVTSCRHGAVSLTGGLSIDPQRCSGCLLCTSICPAGAIEQSSDFTVIVAKLSRMTGAVLGCPRTKDKSNATLACLGGLSAEHLLTLCHSLAGGLTLDLTNCSDCRNKAIIPHLHRRLEFLSASGLLDGGCRIIVAETDAAIRYQVETVDRRSFFKSLRKSLLGSAAGMLTSTNKQGRQGHEYGGKRLPLRREYLNGVRSKLSLGLKILMRNQFDSCADFQGCCTKCQGCVAICPTGALQDNGAESSPAFDQLLCTGCGLCVEFCLEGALQIHPGNRTVNSCLSDKDSASKYPEL